MLPNIPDYDALTREFRWPQLARYNIGVDVCDKWAAQDPDRLAILNVRADGGTENITCPFLVTHAGNDRVVPVENAQKLYDAVGSSNKTIKIFTAEDGGAEHAHVDNRQIGIDFAADWLADNMK